MRYKSCGCITEDSRSRDEQDRHLPTAMNVDSRKIFTKNEMDPSPHFLIRRQVSQQDLAEIEPDTVRTSLWPGAKIIDYPVQSPDINAQHPPDHHTRLQCRNGPYSQF